MSTSVFMWLKKDVQAVFGLYLQVLTVWLMDSTNFFRALGSMVSTASTHCRLSQSCFKLGVLGSNLFQSSPLPNIECYHGNILTIKYRRFSIGKIWSLLLNTHAAIILVSSWSEILQQPQHFFLCNFLESGTWYYCHLYFLRTNSIVEDVKHSLLI